MANSVTYTYKDEQIDAAIAGVEKTAKTLQQSIHNLAVSICQVWQANSAAKKIDEEAAITAMNVAVERINKLQAASPYHSNAFAHWVAKFLPLEWSEENEEWYCHVNNCRFMGKDFVEAKENPFWKVKPAPKVQPFKDLEELERLMNRAKKRLDPKNKKSTDEDVIHPDLWNSVAKLLREAKATDAAKAPEKAAA